jgi:hypothetical protein
VVQIYTKNSIQKWLLLQKKSIWELSLQLNLICHELFDKVSPKYLQKTDIISWELKVQLKIKHTTETLMYHESNSKKIISANKIGILIAT